VRLRSVALSAALLMLLPATPAAQGWLVEATAGAAEYDAVAGEVSSLNAMIGLRYEGARWLSMAAGVPLDSAAIPWAAGGAGGRWSRVLGPWEVGLDAAGLAFAYRNPAPAENGGGATIQALPFVGSAVPYGRLELRAGV